MKIALKYGLIYSGINILWSLLLYVTELNRSESAWVFQMIALAIPVVCIIMAVNEYKQKEGNGFITFGTAFKKGLLICLIGGIIGSAFYVIYLEAIDPSFKDFMMQQQVDKMTEMGMGEEAIEDAINQSAKFQTPFWMFTWGIVGSLFVGAIISLIMAAILKKPDPNVIA